MDAQPHITDHARTRADGQFPDDTSMDLSRQRLLDSSNANFPASDSPAPSYHHQYQQQQNDNYEQHYQQPYQQKSHQQSPYRPSYDQSPPQDYESAQQRLSSQQRPQQQQQPYNSNPFAQTPASNNTYPGPSYPPPPIKSSQAKHRISKKTQKRLYWLIPLCILALVLAILYSVYKDDFERWAQPLTNWLRKREAWSWVIPVVILIVLSLPPLFGHEIVQLVVGLAFPLGVAIGIAIAGSVLGEAFCFIVFKLFGTKYVEKQIDTKVKWAAIARVSKEAGFKGVLVIRYSIVPPHLANPLFACTGMPFWLYMVTVILSLPKAIVFVALGSPSAKGHKGATWAKVVAVGILIVVTIFASIWIRGKLKAATLAIEQERGIVHENEEDSELSDFPSYSQAPQMEHQPPQSSYGRQGVVGGDTAYHGA